MELLSYLTECLRDDMVVRWPESTMPLTVYIAPCRWYKAKGTESYAYQQMAIDSLNIWQKASEGRVSFKLVPTLNESQINIDWRRVDRKSLGHCQFSTDNVGRLFSAEVQIGLSDGVLHSKYMDKSEVMHTIIHEIGHAIGLQHSPYQNDIMYVPHQYGVISITERDKTTLKWLYSFPYGSMSSEILSKYSMPPDYTLDHLIYKLENNSDIKPEFAQTMSSTIIETKDLGDEQNLLANINKYNLSLQNINISPKLQSYIRKTNIEKGNS